MYIRKKLEKNILRILFISPLKSVKTPREKNGLPESYDVYRLYGKEKIQILIKSAVVLFFTSFVFYQNIFISLLCSSLAVFGERFLKEQLIKRRKLTLTYQFKDVLYAISASISAGKQMPQAIKDAYESLQLLYSNDMLMMKELHYMIKRFDETNESMEDIFMDFALRTGVKDIKNFADIYLTCRTTGGDLSDVIQKTSTVILEKMSIKQEIQTVVSQKKLESRILSAIPFIVILFLTLVSPAYLNKMYTTTMGRMIMTLGLIAIGVAHRWSEKITSIEV